MPRRKITLTSNHYYHVFNKSINKESLFPSKYDGFRALKTFDYYRHINIPIRLSFFLRREEKTQRQLEKTDLENSAKHVEILCYCLMPNHFHLLLKQVSDNGISIFMSKTQNSYTKYINTKYDREGHLFKGQFMAVRVNLDSQLLHLSRYIHLNPYTSSLVGTYKELLDYPYSSLYEYTTNYKGFCNTKIIQKFFSINNPYGKFVLDRAEYQKELGKIKKLLLE